MPTIKIDKKFCKGCSLCVEACPLQLICMTDELNEKGYKVPKMDSGKCTGCTLCAKMCPDSAIEVLK